MYIVNSNPTFEPLMRAAALRCTNPNVWWFWGAWQPGLLASPQLFSRDHQPVRKLLSSRGLRMVNVHAPQELANSSSSSPALVAKAVAAPASAPASGRRSLRLDALDKWRLWSQRRSARTSQLRGRDLLRSVLAAEVATAQLPLPGSLPAGADKLALMVVLDLSYGVEVGVPEALPSRRTGHWLQQRSQRMPYACMRCVVVHACSTSGR